MKKEIKADDVIFNFFKQICDEKDDNKCVQLGNRWIEAMENNLINMEANLDENDKNEHKKNIENNKKYLSGLKGKKAEEWRKYGTQCMIEIIDNQKKNF